MKVSIVISTLNRHQVLWQNIKLLHYQSKPFEEIIIIDQSKNVPKDFLDFIRQDKRIKYFRQNVDNVAVGYSEGAKKAKGDIVLYLDDDVIPGYRLVEHHLKNYTDKKIGGVTGRVVEPYNNNIWTNGRANSITKFGNVIQNVTSRDRLETFAVSGGNMSFRKSVIKKAGYFDTNYIGNAYRIETDFSVAVSKIGYKMIFEPNAQIFHLNASTGGTRKTRETARKWYYNYFHNFSYFFFKNCNHLYFPLFLLQKTVLLWGLKCAALGILIWKPRIIFGLVTPISGIINGYKDYKKYIRQHNENRN